MGNQGVATAPLSHTVLEAPRANAGAVRCAACPTIAEADTRIANQLMLLSAEVRRHAGDPTLQPDRNRDARLILEALGFQIDEVARLHRMLSSAPEGEACLLSERLDALCSRLAAALDQQVRLIYQFEPCCPMSAARSVLVTKLVSEVITNAIKHAAPPGGPARITVACRAGGAGAAVVEVADNGGGFSVNFDPARSRSTGMRMIHGLADQLGATTAFVSTDTGVTFRLTLPCEGGAVDWP